MTTSITFRLPAQKRAQLRRKAKLMGLSESEYIRKMLDRELDKRTMGEKIGHLAGSVSLKGKKMDEWQKAIYKNNWRW